MSTVHGAWRCKKFSATVIEARMNWWLSIKNRKAILDCLLASGCFSLWFAPLYVSDSKLFSGWESSREHPITWLIPLAAIVYFWSAWYGRYRIQLVSVGMLVLYVNIVLTWNDANRFLNAFSAWLMLVVLIGAVASTIHQGFDRLFGEQARSITPTLAFVFAFVILTPVFVSLTSHTRSENPLYRVLTQKTGQAPREVALPVTHAPNTPETLAPITAPANDISNNTTTSIFTAHAQVCELIMPPPSNGWSMRAPGAMKQRHFDWLPSARRLTVTSARGDVYLSHDEGRSWVHGYCRGSFFSFKTVQFVDARTAWATGKSGAQGKDAIAETRDGGVTWVVHELQDRSKRELGSVVGLWFQNMRSGVIIGDKCLFVTTDAGETWVRTTSTELRGLAYDVRRQLITRDRGETWLWPQRDEGTESIEVTGVFLRDAHSVQAVVSGNENGANTNDDVGKTLRRFSGPLHGANICHIQVAGNQHGWLVGCDGSLHHTVDGGQNWGTIALFNAHPLFAVQFTDWQTGWAVGGAGTILRTTDGGKNWIGHTLATDMDLRALRFINPKVGWVLSERGSIWHTRDGGSGWVTQRTDSEEHKWSDIHMLDAERGWIVGEKGRLLLTVDGGKHWQLRETTFDESLRSVLFVDRNYGWAVGERGLILHSRDGGLTWKDQPIHMGESLTSVAFRDRRNGWAVGESRFALKTVDGGLNWKAVTLPGEPPYRAIRFFDARRGWLAGRTDWYRTEDGGVSWRAVEMPGQVDQSSQYAPSRAWFVDPNTAWGVSTKGAIWKYSMDYRDTNR